ncbi:hypothetical protein [Gulosibacter molinativorax]|uniref:DUF222 domain-containing protein n=1 Tax=Gulosibacter molinativorax TaxID=256821 RepID=A0ABT7C737_9MICO|nr:hypothetical protein [Gulosibacter molinativorax]MDJ1371004.1 hypothetical protein [Gulosibacter molinativorax]QUY62798.1 Hypotetical protein [Gulosibacter molinativorax]
MTQQDASNQEEANEASSETEVQGAPTEPAMDATPAEEAQPDVAASDEAESDTQAEDATPAEQAQQAQQSSDEIATEGVFIAAATTRLAVKNRILVDTLAGNVNFSVDKYVEFARETLRDLARESEGEVSRIDEMMQRAKRRRSRPLTMHDYAKADLGNLQHRRDLADLVAHKLRERAADDEGVKELVRAAHDAAWGEISRNIQFNLDSEFATVGDLTEEEQADREERMRSVVRVDLPKLEKDLRVIRRRQAAAEREAEKGESKLVGASANATPGLLGRIWSRIRGK